MSDTQKTVSSFVREVLARLKGDAETVIAEKNERKARSAFNGQIAALEARIVDSEDKVGEAEEAFKAAKYPVVIIGSAQSFVEGVRNAHTKWESAKDELSALKESLTFFKNLVNDEF